MKLWKISVNKEILKTYLKIHKLENIGYSDQQKKCNFKNIDSRCKIPSVWVTQEQMHICAKYESSKLNHIGRRDK